jgi:hypothetical protein
MQLPSTHPHRMRAQGFGNERGVRRLEIRAWEPCAGEYRSQKAASSIAPDPADAQLPFAAAESVEIRPDGWYG